MNNLSPRGDIPKTETQARLLAKLKPEQQVEVWTEAVETAPNGKVTTAHVTAVEVVENLLPIGNNLPTTGKQVRPLTPLEPEQQVEAWAENLGPMGHILPT